MSTKQPTTYQTIFETCEEGILVVDVQGRIVLANTSVLKLFGYTLEELQGQTIELLIPHSIRKKHTAYRNEYLKSPKARKMGVGRDLKALKKNGEEFPIEISLNQTKLNGEDHVVAFLIDITERKKVEEKLIKSEEQLIIYATQLENRVTERTKELDNTIKKLETLNESLGNEIRERKKAQEEVAKALEKEKELNELKSRFVSMASHEFRTPLSTILSSASLIARYNNGESEKRARHVDKIKSAIHNLNGILDDFLSLAKLEEGKTALNTSQTDICGLIEDIVEEIGSIKKPGQEIYVSKKGDLRSIETDPKILKNVLINLLSNAIKYSGENSRIDLIVSFEANKLNLEVKDEGMGIPPSEQEHLFERFFRAKNAINIQGTGLGLNIVRKYVEMLEGDISFESIENQGTNFKIELPV